MATSLSRLYLKDSLPIKVEKVKQIKEKRTLQRVMDSNPAKRKHPESNI